MFLTAVGAVIFGVGIVAADALFIALGRIGVLDRLRDALGFGDEPEWMH